MSGPFNYSFARVADNLGVVMTGIVTEKTRNMTKLAQSVSSRDNASEWFTLRDRRLANLMTAIAEDVENGVKYFLAQGFFTPEARLAMGNIAARNVADRETWIVDDLNEIAITGDQRVKITQVATEIFDMIYTRVSNTSNNIAGHIENYIKNSVV